MGSKMKRKDIQEAKDIRYQMFNTAFRRESEKELGFIPTDTEIFVALKLFYVITAFLNRWKEGIEFFERMKEDTKYGDKNR